MNDTQAPAIFGKLFALDFDGKRYQAGFMRPNGNGRYEPIFEDVTRCEFHKLAADHTEFVDSWVFVGGKRTIYQKYDVEAQVQAEHDADMAELRDIDQTQDDAANRGGY